MRFATLSRSAGPVLRALLLIYLTCLAGPLQAYAVLTHEALIDSIWDVAIKPALTRKYPAATPDQLKEAHAYCYGGGIIQDVGYYPFGSHTFSDLTHYVRSGDFVVSLLAQAQDLNEYAFAIGALAHYNADNHGHPTAINRTVPEIYPKLAQKYGPVVTYLEDPTAHIRTEFGFDVVQVARGLYPPDAYHDFIGFKLSKPLLERACEETYGLKLKDIFETLDLALGTYRWSVSKLIPEITKAAWAQREASIRKRDPTITKKTFLYDISRSSYRKEWGNEHQHPGVGARVLAFLFKLVPKVGPFRGLGFHTPPADAELLFEKSFDDTVDQDKADLAKLSAAVLTLPNRDLDTGKLSVKGEYPLADKTYGELFAKLAGNHRNIPSALQADYDRFRTSH